VRGKPFGGVTLPWAEPHQQDRDWCRLEHATGNRHGLHLAITRVQQVDQGLDRSLETETERLDKELLDQVCGGAGPSPPSPPV
jgi:hypothetical protein